MFVSVKSLTTYMDRNINYVNEAIANKSNFDDATFNSYIERMNELLNKQVDSLKKISSNDKLINKYTQKVQELFKEVVRC